MSVETRNRIALELLRAGHADAAAYLLEPKPETTPPNGKPSTQQVDKTPDINAMLCNFSRIKLPD